MRCLSHHRMSTRRSFLSAVSAASAGAMFVPAVIAASAGAKDHRDQKNEDVLGGADDRINKYRKGRCSVTPVGPDGRRLAPGTTVEIAQDRHHFLFGCNIFKWERCKTSADNERYAARFSELLNFATLPFYWWTYERRRGEREDKAAAECAEWCRSHGITPKGHPLAWNFVDPPWMKDVPAGEVLSLQIERIRQCISKFKGVIDIWDVVNEATHYDRDETKRNAPKLTDAIGQAGVGEYLRRSFDAARNANASAQLIINDYRVDPEYQKRVLTELNDSQQHPLYDVIGIQSHMHGGPWPAAKTWEICERFSKYGRPLHFTETTLVSGPKTPGGWQTTAEGEEKQAAQVREFYTLLFSHPSVRAITWWDLSDQDAWQDAPAGLLRHDMSQKPAYDALLDLIKNKWWTRAKINLAADHSAGFDGFFGDYTITADSGGRRLTGHFTHAIAGAGQEVRLE